MRIARDWFEYHDLKGRGIPVSPPTAASRAQAPVVTIPKSTEAPTMDLGTTLVGLLNTAATAAIQDRFSTTAAAAVPTTPADFDIPFIDVVPQAPATKGMVFDPNANCGQGKWIKKRKKRCKNIITPTQMNQLTQIATLFGKNSETTKLIIAKGGFC